MAWFNRWRKGNRHNAVPATPSPPQRYHASGGRHYLNEESYFLPKDDGEISRLDFQHYLLRHTLRGDYVAPIQQPKSILDVGTGTGRWAMQMAEAFPEANVIGIDLVGTPADELGSTVPAGYVRPDNYLFMQGNVLDGLAFPDSTFDFVHQRLLVAGIPMAQWPRVVVELLRVTCPGGWVEMVEAIPAVGGPAMNQLREWLVGVGLPRGVDIRSTHQIGNYLQAAGAQNIQYRELNVPLGQAGGRVGVMMETNYFSLHGGIRGPVLAQGMTTADIFDATVIRAKAEIAQGLYVWPYYIAFGQRPR